MGTNIGKKVIIRGDRSGEESWEEILKHESFG